MSNAQPFLCRHERLRAWRWLCTLAPAAAAAGARVRWAEGHNSRARLIAGTAGRGIAGVELQMPEGWKTYWRNPGDAGGVPPSFDWSKSENLAGAKVLYPAPKRFTDRAGDTVGYKGTVVFPVRLDAQGPGKPIDLRLDARLRRLQGHLHSGRGRAVARRRAAAGGRGAAELAARARRACRAPRRRAAPGDPVLKHACSRARRGEAAARARGRVPGRRRARRYLRRGAGRALCAAAEEDRRRRRRHVDLRGRSVRRRRCSRTLKGKTLTATLVSDKRPVGGDVFRWTERRRWPICR